jgi:hypothetical protein
MISFAAHILEAHPHHVLLVHPREGLIVATEASAKSAERWRARLTRDVAWSLLVKFGLLALMWALFFSSAHRCRVDGAATASRLALSTDRTQGGRRCD